MASQGGTSRLTQVQKRFQQKQQEERAHRKLQMTELRNELDNGNSLNSSIGTGKVCQMSVERRQHTTGLDKRYPLKPISPRLSSAPARPAKATSAKKQTIIKQINGRVTATNNETSETIVRNENEDSIDNGNSQDIRMELDNEIRDLTISEELPNLEKTSKISSPISDKSMPSASLKKTTDKAPSNSDALIKRSLNSTATKIASVSEPLAGPESAAPKNMATCRRCGRNFNVDRIENHEKICEKISGKKRKIFDVTKYRIGGTEVETYVRKLGNRTRSTKPADAGASGSVSRKKNNWRQKHEEFIQAMRAARKMKPHLARGGKLADLPPPPPSENSDYVQCPHCSRRFNQSAAERHIPKCATMLHNKPKPCAAPNKKR